MNPIMKYPVFVPDQVLTAKNLNDIVQYLNEQNLSTRRNLIGIGIVCGLNVSSDLNKYVKISCGCGVTSLGLLIDIDELDARYYRRFTDMATPPYKKFIQTGKKQYKLWELLTEKEYLQADDPVNDKKLEGTSEFRLRDMVVLLYLEKIDKDLDNCIDEGCDDLGIMRLFNLRKLLIRKGDLLKILGEEETTGLSEFHAPIKESDIFRKLKPACALPELANHRLSASLGDIRSLYLSKIISFEKLKNAFLDVIKADVIGIGKALYKSYVLFEDELIKLYPTGNPFSGYQDTAIGNNDLYALIQTEVNKDDLNIQYAYDLLCDLVKAYTEFSEIAASYKSKCCIDTERFPYHLMLDVLSTGGRRSEKIYRHQWQPSPAVSSMNDLLDKLRLLHYKLYMMVENFKLRSFTKLSDIKITPGKYSGWPFSEHTMGHYYNDGTPSTIQNYWSYELARRCKEKTVLSYFPEQYSSRHFVLHPLLYNLQDYEYYRIEGHLGQEYNSVLDYLREQIKDFNLPFDVFGIKLSGTDKLDIEIGDHCFNDIQTTYKCNRDEYLSCLGVVSAQINGIVNLLKILEKNPGFIDLIEKSAPQMLPFITSLQQMKIIFYIYAAFLNSIQNNLPEHIKDFKFPTFKISHFVVWAFTMVCQLLMEYLSNLFETSFFIFTFLL